MESRVPDYSRFARAKENPNQLHEATAFILDSEAATGASGLESYIYSAPITRADVDDFARLSPASSDPEHTERWADALWTGLTSLKKRQNEYSVIEPPRLGKLMDSIVVYKDLLRNFYGFNARVHFGNNWTNSLADYCIAFTDYKKDQLEHAYAQTRTK